jgi:hypothetical protein
MCTMFAIFIQDNAFCAFIMFLGHFGGSCESLDGQMHASNYRLKNIVQPLQSLLKTM